MANDHLSATLGPFSVHKRLDNLDRMEQETFDLLIIGGGLTGAGIASEAARWGYKVALVEKGDFASGAAQPPLSGRNLEDWDHYRSHWQAALAVGSPLPDDIARHLVATYGSELPAVLRLLTEEPALAQRLTRDLPVIKAQIIHAIRNEMALTLSDVLDRRTHLQTQAADQGLSAVEAVAHLMATELGWTSQEKARQIAAYRQQLTAACSWRERIAV